MVKKAANAGGYVERRKLMKGAGRQALVHQFGRSDRAAGEKHVPLCIVEQRFDQRQDRGAFADTRAMNPDQLSGGTWPAGEADAFPNARAVLLAAPAPRVEVQRHHGRGAGG